LRRLAQNSLWNVTSLVVALLIGFITTPIVLSLLGVSRYGLWVILVSVLFPLGLTNFNFGQATIKYVAEADGRSDLNEAGIYVRNTFLFNLVVGVVGATVIAVLANWLTTRVFNIELADQPLAQACLLWLGVGWLVQQILNTFSNIAIGFQRYDLSAMGNVIYSLSAAVLSLSVLYRTHDLLTFVQSRILVQVLAAGGWFLLTRRLLPGVSLLPAWNRTAFRRSFRFGVWQTLGQLGGMAALQADKYILGILLSTATVGLYDVAMTVQKNAYSLGARFGEVLFPAFSHISAENNRARQAWLLMRSTWLLTTISMGIMVPVFVLGGDFLHLWVGPVVAAGSAHVLQVLAVAGLLGSASNAGVYYLLGIGKTEWTAAISTATGITVAVFSILLIPRLGIAGAGWGNVAAMFVQAFVVTYMWRYFFSAELRFPVYVSSLYGPVLTGLAMCGLLSLLRTSLALPITWMWFAVNTLVCSGLTILVIVTIDRVLPGGAIRHQDVQRLAAGMTRRLISFWPG
jgi:O-antigen/teichoic acid export membrane protein